MARDGSSAGSRGAPGSARRSAPTRCAMRSSPRFAQGVPARAIMEVLGHAEIGVTMNTYAHVLPVLRQEAADAIDELFGA
jgi:integrase